jgi:hypothetical protein
MKIEYLGNTGHLDIISFLHHQQPSFGDLIVKNDFSAGLGKNLVVSVARKYRFAWKTGAETLSLESG